MVIFIFSFWQRLRTENKLLKQRIEILESESSELANKLIQGQVGRAEEVETTFALKRELAAMRQVKFYSNYTFCSPFKPLDP